MKRPANNMDERTHQEQDQEEDHAAANRRPRREERLTSDVGCQHPTNMRSAQGSNKHFARMVCRSCGLLLYKVERRPDPRQTPDEVWADIWDNLKYWERIAILRVLTKNRKKRGCCLVFFCDIF